MTDLSEASRLEPVMEALLEETVVTTPCLVLELEMRTCELEELQISSVFYLKVQRQDYLTALFTHFDMLFTLGRHPVILSTGPRSPPTHWKQMIFCLKEDLVVKKVGGVEKLMAELILAWLNFAKLSLNFNLNLTWLRLALL